MLLYNKIALLQVPAAFPIRDTWLQNAVKSPPQVELQLRGGWAANPSRSRQEKPGVAPAETEPTLRISWPADASRSAGKKVRPASASYPRKA